MTAKDSTDNYRDATAEEKQQWEAQHPEGNAVPARPSWADLAEEAGAVRHDDRGYWSLNGLDDITDEQMLTIYDCTSHYPPKRLDFEEFWTYYHSGEKTPRTTLQTIFRTNLAYPEIHINYGNLQVLRLIPDVSANHDPLTIKAPQWLCTAYSLVRIDDHLGLNQNITYQFYNNHALKTCYLHITSPCTVNLSGCEALTYDSLAFMVDNAKQSGKVTIQLDAQAYARLTDELIAQASAKQITFTSA